MRRERFKTLLTNWYRGVKGRYKVPVFAHKELDLHKVFWTVQDKGGYDYVCLNKQWKASSQSLLVYALPVNARPLPLAGCLLISLAVLPGHVLSACFPC